MSDESPLLTPSPPPKIPPISSPSIHSPIQYEEIESNSNNISPLTQESSSSSHTPNSQPRLTKSGNLEQTTHEPHDSHTGEGDTNSTHSTQQKAQEKLITSTSDKICNTHENYTDDSENEEALLTPEHLTQTSSEAPVDERDVHDRWRSSSPETPMAKSRDDVLANEDTRQNQKHNIELTPHRTHNSLLNGCARVDIYKKLNKISEGTYGTVFRAQNKLTGEIVAMKHIKYHKKLWEEGFPITCLREISILLELDHPNIVLVREVVVGNGPDQVFMVMDYVEHELKALLDNNKPEFSVSERKCLLLQLLHAINYLHKNWVIHRDLKTSNLLYSNKGELKLCDFGMARKFGDPIRPYTHNVITLWYRAPELILGQQKYTQAVDMWSVGCIFGEIVLRKPLFPGSGEEATLGRIFKLCGSPNENLWPGFNNLPACKRNSFPRLANHKASWREQFPFYNNYFSAASGSLSEAGLDLLQRLLELCPEKRISAAEAIKHPYFTVEKPAPQPIGRMPTVPETNSQARRKKHKDSKLEVDEKKLQEEFHDASFRFGVRVDAEQFLSELEQQKSNKETSRHLTSNPAKAHRAY